MSKSNLTGSAVVALFLLGAALMAGPVSSPPVVQVHGTHELGYHTLSQGLTEHAPLQIDTKSDFSALGLSGTGTLQDPYVIENMLIGGQHDYGISIKNINAYVLIRNVQVEIDGHAQIYLDNCLGITLEDVDVIGGWTGITCSQCASLNITAGQISDVTDVGLVVQDCQFHSVTGLKFLRCNSAANLDDVLFEYQNVNVTGGLSGISVGNGSGSSISDSFFSNCKFSGLRLYSTSSMKMSGNTFRNCSVWIFGSTIGEWTHSINSNTVNGKPLGYIMADNGSVVDLDNYGEMIVACSENTTLKGGSTHGLTVSIDMAFCKGCLINGTSVGQCEIAIRLTKCNMTSIEHCSVTGGVTGSFDLPVTPYPYAGGFSWNETVLEQTQEDVCITGCNSVSVEYCDITRGGYGIRVEASTNITIDHNRMTSMNTGVCLDYGVCNCSVVQNEFAFLQLLDNGYDNTWNKNSYYDYDMSGTYHIPGRASAVDTNPSLYSSGDVAGSIYMVVLLSLIAGLTLLGVAVLVRNMRHDQVSMISQDAGSSYT